MKTWYALTVMPRREFQAADSLAQRGFEAYVPMVRKFRGVNRYVQRKRLRSFALMPGYVFLGVESVPEWYLVLCARYVRGVISVDAEPLKVPLFEMDGLKNREAGGEFTAWDAERYMISNREFSVGDDAEIVVGPFAGQSVKVLEIGEETAKVLLTMFGGERCVEVGLEVLEAA